MISKGRVDGMTAEAQREHAKITSYRHMEDTFIPTPEGMKALAEHHERMMRNLMDIIIGKETVEAELEK